MILGARDQSAIVAWLLKKKSGTPAVTLSKVDDVNALQDSSNVVVIGFFKVTKLNICNIIVYVEGISVLSLELEQQ